MGLITADNLPDINHLSGTAGRIINRPAIHSVLSKEEIQNFFGHFHPGSGGKITGLLTASASGAKTQVKEETQQRLDASINEICSIFQLTKEELAQVCKIQSRKTLYNWINGTATPRKAAMSRMFDVLVAARAWQHAGFAADKQLLRQPVIEGQSVFELLNEPEIDKERILFAGARLTMMSPTGDAIIEPFK